MELPHRSGEKCNTVGRGVAVVALNFENQKVQAPITKMSISQGTRDHYYDDRIANWDGDELPVLRFKNNRTDYSTPDYSTPEFNKFLSKPLPPRSNFYHSANQAAKITAKWAESSELPSTTGAPPNPHPQLAGDGYKGRKCFETFQIYTAPDPTAGLSSRTRG